MHIFKITLKYSLYFYIQFIHIPNLTHRKYKEYFLLKTNNIIVLCHQTVKYISQRHF